MFEITNEKFIELQFEAVPEGAPDITAAVSRTASLTLHSRKQLLPDQIVGLRAGDPSGSTVIVITPAVMSCEPSPSFVLQKYDGCGTAFGRGQYNGYDFVWRCDGESIKTDLPGTEEQGIADSTDFYGQMALMFFPYVAWLEPRSPETSEFRRRYLNGHDVSLDECYRYIDQIYYTIKSRHRGTGRILALETGCSYEECTGMQPAASRVMDSPKRTIFPWNSPDTAGIPNDYSVSSALAGKYRLDQTFGTVSENGGEHSYDFSKDVVPLSFLGEYVDNTVFRTCLRNAVKYLELLFRKNGLDDDASNGSLFGYIGKSGVGMLRSYIQNTFISGDPGTGKTVTVKAVAAALGLPMLTVRVGVRTEESDLTQLVEVTKEGLRTRKAPMYWYVRYGGIIVIDDLTNADANMLFNIIGNLLESPYSYSVGGELVYRHPVSFMYGTANIGTVGSNEQNPAMLTRWTHLEAQMPDEKDFIENIRRGTLNATGALLSDEQYDRLCKWVYDTYIGVFTSVRKRDSQAAAELLTLRSAISLATQISTFVFFGDRFDAVQVARETVCNILKAGNRPEAHEAIGKALSVASMPVL